MADELPQETLRPGAVVPVDALLVDRIEKLLGAGDRHALLAFLDELYPADVARVMVSLGEADRQRLFTLLPAETASEVLMELEDDERETVLEDAPTARVAEILNELDSDDAADVIADLDQDVADAVLPQLEDADEIRELLLYAGDTAGGIMATEFVSVPDRLTVAQATEEVRRQAEDVEDVYVVFVTDPADRLVGLLSLQRLLLSPASARVREIMETDFVSVEVDVDQEEVARMMARYDLVSLPVVDKAGRLVGRITIDDVVDVLREEASEDLQVIAGSGDEGLNDTALQVSRGRLPWLVLGLIGTIMSASIVSLFGGTVEQVAVLAALMPVVTAMAGNAAIQSASITVQGLTSGRLMASDAFKRIGKEFVVALVNGTVLSLLIGGAVLGLGWLHVGLFALPMAEIVRVAGMAMIALLTVIVLATLNGALVPVVLTRLGLDPAVSMGPFVTTANDILGLTIYFSVATALLV
jgi:magnesium transporter